MMIEWRLELEKVINNDNEIDTIVRNIILYYIQPINLLLHN